jgi:hypothetical protein
VDGKFAINPNRFVDDFFYKFNKPNVDQHDLFTNEGFERVYKRWEDLPVDIRGNIAMSFLFLCHNDREFYARSKSRPYVSKLLFTWSVEGLIHHTAYHSIEGLDSSFKLNEAYLRGVRYFPGFERPYYDAVVDPSGAPTVKKGKIVAEFRVGHD